MKRSLFNLLLFFLSLFFVFRIFPVFSQTPTQISAEQLIQQAERAYQSGNLSEAVENYQKALNFFQSQGHKELNNLAISSTNLCRIQLELGQAENALQNCQISTQIYSQLSDNNGRIRSQVYQAYALHKLGFYPHACLLLAQSVEISVKSCEELTPELVREKTHNLSQNLAPSLVTAWRILGDTLRSMGDLNKSQIILEKLTSIASDPDPAATLLSLGNTLTAIANLERDRQAEPQYNYLPWKCQVSSLSEQTKKHYKIALETYDRSLQKTSSQILKTKAKLNRFRGLLEISEYSQAATLADEIKLENLPLGQFKVYATINYSKNIACLQQQYFQKARFEESFIARLNEAIQDAKKNGDKATESYVIGSLGGLYEYLQKFPEAEAKTQEALYIAQEFPDLFYQWQWQLGRIFEAKGEQEKALQNYESAVENLETYRQSLLSINSDVQFSFRDNIEPLYKHLINLLLSDRESSTDFELTSYKQEEAFSKEKISRDAIYRVSTLLKPSILDFRFSNNPKSPSGSAVSTRRETEAVRSWGLPKWSNCRPRLELPHKIQNLKLSGSSETQNLEKALYYIESLQLDELSNFLRCNPEDFSREERSQLNVQKDAIATLSKQLARVHQADPNAAIIYPIVLSDRLATIVSLPGENLRFHTVSLSSDRIAQIVTTLRQYLKTPRRDRQFQELSQQLYRWIISPLEDELTRQKPIKTLVFILDSALQNIPMSALFDGKKYLIEKYAVVLIPSLQLLNPQPIPRGEINALMAGATDAPSFEQENLSSLPYVREELNGISHQVSSAKELLEQEFIESNVQKQINANPFSIVHIATHGSFSSDPEQTYILDWSQRIRVEDLERLLRLSQRRERQPINLLILSACETATGDRRAALGLAGVAIRAGARSTIATLWQVNDASTAELMIQFYRNLQNPQLTKAEALRQAQLWLLNKENYRDRDYNRAYYWAPFIIVGNWL